MPDFIETFIYHYVILRNMELISTVSKGSRMDQIYIPKNRHGLSIGSYVVIKPLENAPEQAQEDGENKSKRYFYYNIDSIEPLKIRIINEIMFMLHKYLDSYDNILITGSFAENGFNFNDIDIVVVSSSNTEIKPIQAKIQERTGIKADIIVIANDALIEGLSTDPLYQMMLSKCIARERFIYKIKDRIDYKVLDLHLLKSKPLIDNFDVLNGGEKYHLTRNLAAIKLFLHSKKISKESVDREIKSIFSLKDIMEIKDNLLDKKRFIAKYKRVYDETFKMILAGINK